jgi:hypothetical protein
MSGGNTEVILTAVRDSLRSLTVPRFFETERGYQGGLLVELSKRLPKMNISPAAVLEQEYQKRMGEHGLSIRPDLIIHEPFDRRRHADRTEGNYAVFELKLRASAVQARDDFANLIALMEALNYPLGVFINIDASETHLPTDIVSPGRIAAFAVALDGDTVKLTEDER